LASTRSSLFGNVTLNPVKIKDDVRIFGAHTFKSLVTISTPMDGKHISNLDYIYNRALLWIPTAALLSLQKVCQRAEIISLKHFCRKIGKKIGATLTQNAVMYVCM
jgi:hypothetical protein